jgi:hypothetical protein
MAITLDGNLGITFPSGSVQNNAVANNAAITALVGSRGLSNTIVPAGTVLQIVTATDNSVTSGSGNENYGLLGLTATITPYFSTSKILIVGHLQGMCVNNRAWGQIRRSIAGGAASVITNYFNGGNSNRYYHFGDFYTGGSITDLAKLNSATWIDLPATTSSVQYKFYMSVDSTGTWYNNSTAGLSGSSSPGMGSSCMIMEIAQ